MLCCVGSYNYAEVAFWYGADRFGSVLVRGWFRNSLFLLWNSRIMAVSCHLDRTCEYLVRTHMERNDKVIIFGDNVFSLKKVW